MHMHLRFLTILALAGAAFSGEPRVKVLILTGHTDLPYHDWRQTTPRLRAMLDQTGRFDVRVAEHPGDLTAADLAPYGVLLLNYNGPRWPAATEAAVEQFVSSGKGMFSFHGASYGEFYGMVFETSWQASPTSDRGWAAYPRLVGATWDPPKIGHGARHVFSVKWIDREHPIARGLDETFEADDELYHR
ncbi:MAG TPA: ThuA domain-containing protein, partial [Bryobacteraceae bacterium]